MLIKEKKVTVELIDGDEKECKKGMTNPLNSNNEKIAEMVTNILDNELPMLKNNSLRQ